MDLNTIYRVIEDVEPSEFGEDLAMINMETGEYFIIDEVGSDIFHCINGETSVEKIIMELQKDYEVDYETCKKHTITFLEKLFDSKILEIVKE